MPAIRPETEEDIEAIYNVNELAFGGPDEANLVDRLRENGAVILSLVALDGDQVVGHILFTPVMVDDEGNTWNAVALGPMAVLPGHQRRGIGSMLISTGLDELRRTGHEVVIVLGHPTYYPRFGFKPTRPLGIRWEHDVPEEVFMLAELHPGALGGRRGVVRYRQEFNIVE